MLEAEALVQPSGFVVDRHAQAQGWDLLLDGGTDHSVQEKGAGTNASSWWKDSYGNLRSVFVDEAITGIVRGEVAPPRCPDGRLLFRDDAEVAGCSPAVDVVSEAWDR
jgi:hypothetical protein